MLREKLKHSRQERGWTQVQLSARSGVPQTTISGIESGRVESPRVESVEALASALGVAVYELIGTRPSESLPPEERDEFCARFDALDVEEQRTLLRLVRQLSALPPIPESG